MPVNLRVFSVLRFREYRLFWLGAVFSNLGIWALVAGRLWLMHRLTESPLMLGLLTISGMGPILLLSMLGGVIADRVNRLRLITFTRGVFALLALLTAVLIVLDVIRPWHLIAISLATGILLSFDLPSRHAILPNLVPREQLLNAIVLYSLIFGGAAIVGPSYFAPFVNLVGEEGLFFLVGGSYVLTVAMLLMMKPMRNPGDARQATLWQDLVEGLAYIRGRRFVLSLVVISAVAGLFGLSFATLLPIVADEILDGGVEAYSLLLLGIGAGGLAGTLFLALFGDLRNSSNLQLLTALGFGIGLAVFSRMTWLPASVSVLVFVSACSSAFATINNTLLQSIVDDEFRGRVMSIHQLGWGASAIGGLLMGFLAHVVDVPFALTLGGLATASVAGTLSLMAARWRPATA